MLRGRRLPLPQAPLPEWRTTAPTTTVLATTAIPRARHISSSKDLQSDGDGESHPEIVQETSHEINESQQKLRSEGTAARAGPAPRAAPRIFRKTVERNRRDENPEGGSDGQIDVKYYHIQPQYRAQQQSAPANHFVRIRKFDLEDKNAAKAAIADQARAQTRGPSSRHIYYTLAGLKPFQGQGTSNRTDDDAAQTEGPRFPLVVKDPATAVPRPWTLAVAKQLGIKPRGNPTDLKRVIARRLGLNSWAQAPAVAKAAIKARLSNIKNAVALQGTLTAKGRSAPFPQRDYEAVGKSPPLPRRRHSSQPEKPAVEGIVAGNPPGSLPELISSRAIGNPTLKDGFLVGKGLNPLISQSSREKSSPRPRFTVLPTWLPWDKIQAMKAAPEPIASEQVSSETGNGSPMPNGGANGQVQHVERQGGRLASARDTKSTSLDGTTEPAEPAVDKQSIFDMLFVAKRKRARPEIDSLKSLFLDVEGDLDPGARVAVNTPLQPQQTDGSIYRKLFPEESQVELEEPKQDSTEPFSELLVPPEESLFISLRNEVRNWVPEETLTELTAPEIGNYGSHSTVIVLTGASNSLVDSDFYRIIPEGSKYIEGWAGGLVKIVQARDPLTHEPVGQYFLMFHSRPAAVAYADEARRLHELAQRLLHTPPSSGRKLERGSLEQAPTNPQPFLTEEERVAVQSFTLCSPDMPLRLSIRMWGTEMVGQIASKTNIAGVVQQLRPEAETPATVLLTVSEGHGIASGGLTTDELWLTLRDDGRERGAPWVLKNLKEGIVPVKPQAIVDAKGKIRLRSEAVAVPVDANTADAAEEDMVAEPSVGGPHSGETSTTEWWAEKPNVSDQKESFKRFILTFSQLAIARRFVRCWHKQVIWDEVLHRHLVVDAVTLS